ncbi:MAG: oligosaccharide flippase family protein [Candidatus Zhuqueibacterota bacterium]
MFFINSLRDELNKVKQKAQKLLTGDGLKSKVVRGSFWLGSANSLEQGLRLVRNMILARILAPDVFGLMAIVMAINVFFESFTEIGIKQAIIQSPQGEQNSYLNSGWWVSVARSASLYFIAFIFAPLLSDFYNLPDLIILIRVAFISILFKGFMSPSSFVTIKNMNFIKWVKIFNVGSYIGILTSVVLSLIIRNIWALVIGLNVEWLARLILSYLYAPFSPQFKIDKNAFRNLIKYSKGMFGLPILTFIFMRADIFVIGKLCPASDLGMYSLVVSLATIPFQMATKLISDVTMPAFSTIQTDRTRLRKTFIKVSSKLSIVTIPFLLFSILYSRDLLFVIYGQKYMAISIPFCILMGTSVIRLISTPIAGLYLAIGQPHLHRYFTAIRAFLIILFIYPSIKFFGLIGAASAGFLSMSIGYIFQVGRLSKIIDLNKYSYFKIFVNAIMVSVVIIFVWIVGNKIFVLDHYLNLLTGIFLSFLLYFVLFAIKLKLKYKLPFTLYNIFQNMP